MHLSKFRNIVFIVLALVLAACWQKYEVWSSAYEVSISQLDEEIASLSERAKEMPNSWLAHELVALKYLARARLSADYQDYSQAEAFLEQSLDISGVGGAHMTMAQLYFSLHRLEESAAHLVTAESAIVIPDPQKAAILGLKADIAFYQGKYQEALEGYQAALSLDRNSSHLFRLARYSWSTGDFNTAESYLDEAEQAISYADPQLKAFLHLHKGLLDLDRGRYAEALAHYQTADAAFDGWWLIEEHIAEIYVLEGKLAEAEEIYTRIIAETAHPEFMEALAEISSGTLAADLLEQARASYERDLEQFPEASYGHALAYYLSINDGERALELAQANHTLRPYGAAKIMLAQAYVLTAQLSEAQTLIEEALNSPWRSAELHASAALIFEVLGDVDRARLERSKALDINPDAVDDVSWLAEHMPRD